jgi:uracil-DNA glycosylase
MNDAMRQLRQRLDDLRRSGIDRLPLQIDEPTQTLSPPASVLVAPAASQPQPSAARPIPEPARIARMADSLLGSEELPVESLDGPSRVCALRVLSTEVAACVRCPELVANRTQTVFGEGNPLARLMFIGEAPGETEDRTGRPFVGRAGQLLTDMITKGMGLAREDVFIANTLKCRPPGNRDPLLEEQRNCFGYLERQIELIRPEFICLLGKPATQAILGTAMPMKNVRLKWHRYKGIPTIATWHPAYLLRNPAAKKDTWEDLQMLMKAMGLSIPRREIQG